MRALAVDVGGTKLAAAVVDARGALVAERRAPTPPRGDAETLFGALLGLIGRVLSAAPAEPARLAGIGVGCGGPMRWPAGEVSPLNIPGWRGFPLRRRLAEAFPGVPVRLHNDAACFVAGEHWLGAGRGRADVLGMVVSTGVGGGLVLGGRLVDGATGNAGHVGHVVVEPGGPPCGCGARGCLEAVARGPAVLAWAREHGWPAGPAASGADLVAAAVAGDPVAAAALARAGRAVGAGLASAVALCDPALVVVGGGLAQAGEWLFGPLREAYAGTVGLEFARRVPIEPAGLGQAAGLVGAAALVLAGERYWSPDRSAPGPPARPTAPGAARPRTR